MVTCENCGTENQDNEVYCYSCGNLLSTVGTGSTSLLGDENDDDAQPKRRWGTARFDRETKLILRLKDITADPMHVTLDGEKVVGRKHSDFVPAIDLSPFDAHRHGVSRKHAVLKRHNDTIVVVDLNSANSTFLNGQRLVPDQPRILRDGDELRFGQLTVQVTFDDVTEI